MFEGSCFQTECGWFAAWSEFSTTARLRHPLELSPFPADIPVGYTFCEVMERCNGSEFEENAADWLGASVPGGHGHAAPSARTTSRWPIMLGAAVIVLAAAAAYSNSLRCPFVFDDTVDIVGSMSIRHLWPVWDVFFVRVNGRTSLHGRPVAKLSLALNYATGGLDPLPYHLTNLLIHALAGLTLFGIVRRTLLLPGLRARFATAATGLGLAVALLWTLHPLQTAAVTCAVQRYESMMGLFSLMALYAAIRCGTSKRPGGWAVASVAATLLALGCKEVAVSAPLLILLYDRAFLAGSFREAWRRHWGMYLGFAAAWGAFAVLYACSCDRTDWAGYGLPISWLEYATSQFGVILHYLRLRSICRSATPATSATGTIPSIGDTTYFSIYHASIGSSVTQVLTLYSDGKTVVLQPSVYGDFMTYLEA